MSNIKNELNNIKNAIYGKDVRNSIHNAIKQCYDDASVNNDNANMEVKLARGTHNTLNDRLSESDKKQEELNSQLEYIANKGTTVEVIERVTKDEIDRQIADGTIANLTIEENSIDISKLSNDTLGFVGNIISSTWEISSFVNGEIKPVETGFTIHSDFIPLGIGSIIKLNSGFAYKLIKYSFDGIYESIGAWVRGENIATITEEGLYRIQLGYNPTSTTYINTNNIQEVINSIKFVSTFINIDSIANNTLLGCKLLNKSISKEKLGNKIISQEHLSDDFKLNDNSVNINNLENRLKNQLAVPIEFENGGMSNGGALQGSSLTRIRSTDWIYLREGDRIEVLNDLLNAKVRIHCYNEPNFESWTQMIAWVKNYEIEKDGYYRLLYSRSDIYDNVEINPEMCKYDLTIIPSSLYNLAERIVEKKHLKEKIISREHINDDTYYNLTAQSLNSDSDLIFTFPITGLGSTYSSDHTFVGDELWLFGVSNDTHTDYKPVNRYKIDLVNKQAELLGSFTHNFGHCNTVDYCNETDTLIMGNGGSDYSLANEFYIIPNAKSLKDLQQVNYEDVSIVVNCSTEEYGSKLNVCWGESNGGKYNIAYLITDDNATIIKILLGQGSNNLGKGNFITGKTDNEFNGSYKILKVLKQETLGYDECNQGSDYMNGVLYTGIGHDGLWYWKMNIQGNEIIKSAYKEEWYLDDGSITKPATRGICVTKDLLFINVNNVMVVMRK